MNATVGHESASKDAYLATLDEHMGKEKAGTILGKSGRRSASTTRVFYHKVQQQQMVSLADFEKLNVVGDPDYAVLVVENIELNWIATLGVALDVDPYFFAEHILSPQGQPGQTPWSTIFGKSSASWRRPVQNGLRPAHPLQPLDAAVETRKSWHVDGVFQYEGLCTSSQGQFALIDPNHVSRQVACDEDYGWQTTTRISYCLVRPDLYLFLVDAPLKWLMGRERSPTIAQAQLHLPLALNRGGLVLPHSLGAGQFSMCECLHAFFSHPWHFRVLFTPGAHCTIRLAPETVFHLLVTSTWGTNLRALERDIKRISFEDIRRPNIRINDELHNHRRDISLLVSQVPTTLKWIPAAVNAELEDVEKVCPNKYIGFPDVGLRDVVERAELLEKFLMDTFSLLMSSISIMEAESSKDQAYRGQVLTQLAFIYVPLSFVTGVFGMNVKEINGSPLSVWTAAVAVSIVVIFTAVLFVLYKWWKQGQKIPLYVLDKQIV